MSEDEDVETPDAGSHDTAKEVLKVAAASVAVGAAAAAARALANRSDGREDDEPEDEPEHEYEPVAEDTDEPEDEEEHEEPDEAETDEPREPDPEAQATAPGDVAGVIDAARQQLQAILGRPPDSVSGFERSDGGWLVRLEVVEVERIPSSTDVLASYELRLDGDRNLVRYQRGRRYHRSQAGLEETS